MCYTNKKRMKITRGFRVPERARKKKKQAVEGKTVGNSPRERRRGKSNRDVTREDKDGPTATKERKGERNGRGLKRAEGLEWLLAPSSLLRSPRYSLEHCQASARAQDCRSVHDSRSRERHERAGYELSTCTKRRISKDVL